MHTYQDRKKVIGTAACAISVAATVLLASESTSKHDKVGISILAAMIWGLLCYINSCSKHDYPQAPANDSVCAV